MLSLGLLSTKAYLLLDGAVATPPPESFWERGRYSDGTSDQGWLAEQLKTAFKELGKTLKDGFLTFLNDLAKGTVYLLSPFIEWGAKSALVILILAIYCTNGEDKKNISSGIKIFIVYIIWMAIRSAVL
jgi:hypothetical protein